MNKKKTAITIFFSILLIIIVSCSDINPFFAGGVVPGGNWIYFSEGSNIKRMRLDGSELESVFTVDTSEIREIQLDPFRQKIYISSHIGATAEKIREYNLDGSGSKEIINTDAIPIVDMKIDAAAGYLYYISSNYIKKVLLETGKITNYFDGPSMAMTPDQITPDYKGGVYFLDGGSLNKVIDLNSFTWIDVHPTAPTISAGGLYYDKMNDYLYYYDTGSIYKVDPLTGNSSNLSVFEDIQNSMALYPSDDKIYFYDAHAAVMPYTIFSINMDGSGKKTVYSNNFEINAFDILSK